MRYVTLLPKNARTLDPRKLSFPSLDHLHQLVTVDKTHETQFVAAHAVREVYPDALCMPLPVKMGSGQIFLLGVLENAAVTIDPEIEIPFVMFVHAQPEHDQERAALKKGSQWKPDVWKAPVLYAPANHKELAIEVRANNLDFPSRVTGRMFRRSDKDGRGGHVVLHATVGEAEVSIEFLDPIPSELV